MSDDVLKKIGDAIAEECHEDYVGLWELVKDVKRAFPEASAREVQKTTLELVRDLLSTGRAVAGDLSNDGDFCDWRLSVDLCVARVREEWDRLGHEPNIAEVVWLTAP